MGILGFQKYSRFLGYRTAVAYDSASFAAMHFRLTITKKTNYQVANIQRSTEAFTACFQYSRCLIAVCGTVAILVWGLFAYGTICNGRKWE